MSLRPIIIIAVVAVIVAAFIFGAFSGASGASWADLPKNEVVIEPVVGTLPKRIVVPPVKPVVKGDSELAKVIRDLGAPPVPSYTDGEIVGLKPSDGLGVVAGVLHTSTVESFIGRFDSTFIVPGAIVDCVPYVRADLGANVRALGSLERQPYEVDLFTFAHSPSGEDSTGDSRAHWTVGGSRQDQQRGELQGIMARLQGDAEKYRSPVRYRQSVRYARTLEEAQARLGLSLRSRFVEADLDAQRRGSRDRAVFIGMAQQEYFRLGVSPSDTAPKAGPEAWIVDNPANLKSIQAMNSRGEGWPGVPALLSSVRYGRVIIVAFEIEIESEQEWLDLNGKYENPSSSFEVHAWNEALRRHRGATIDVIVYGGGTIPSGLGVDVVEGAESRLGEGIGTQDDAPGQVSRPVTHIQVSKAKVIDVLQELIDSGKKWGPESLGLPIGLEMVLLDDAGTALRPFQFSMATLAQQFENQPGWNIYLTGNINRDFDSGWGDAGDWELELDVAGEAAIRWNGDVKDPTTIQLNGRVGRPSGWGATLASSELRIKDVDDGFMRGGDDNSSAGFGSIINTAPAEVTTFWSLAGEHEIKFASFSDALADARKTETWDSDSTAQEVFATRHAEALKVLRSRQPAMSKSVDALITAGLTAQQALERRRTGDLKVSTSSDDNSYTVTACPDVSGEKRAIELLLKDLKTWRLTAETYIESR